MVLVEAPILGGDERLLHVIGNVGQRHPDAAIARLEDVGVMVAAAVEHLAHAGQLLALQLRRVGQIGHRLVVERDHVAEVDHRLVDGLVLAELVIGGIEVAEIEPMQRLDVGAHRFRVIERGRDQIVEVDRFDVEGLAHMGAAVAQQLHHLVLVFDRIELRLHRVRVRRDLTERQRGREKLDKNGVHGGRQHNPVLGTQSLYTIAIIAI